MFYRKWGSPKHNKMKVHCDGTAKIPRAARQ
jgi:hypothetical protein